MLQPAHDAPKTEQDRFKKDPSSWGMPHAVLDVSQSTRNSGPATGATKPAAETGKK